MLSKIADLLVEIPNAGGIAPRCKDYIVASTEPADIVLNWHPGIFERDSSLDEDGAAYLETGWLFYPRLLNYNGMMLHASAVEYNGKAYLFSGPSGIGKSTHTRLFCEVFEGARVFNDDKPAIRYLDGRWFAYGTPWCGKDGINVNLKAELGGICFLRRGEKNSIRRLTSAEAVAALMSQTIRNYITPGKLDKLVSVISQLVSDIPIFELTKLPDKEAATLSYNTMKAAEDSL